MKITTILFDLDGTLTDSGEGIMNSVRYAVEKYGMKVDESSLSGFIGPPLHQQFQEVCGVTEEESYRLVALYREYYTKKGIFENAVYTGITELLKTLKEDGYRICMATSKPEVFAEKIAHHFGLAKYFDKIGGSLMDGGRVNKADVIEYVLEEMHVCTREEVLMIGDRKHDISGAKRAGVHSMGVLFGYGSREELKSAGAELIAETPKEIGKLIRKYAAVVTGEECDLQ